MIRRLAHGATGFSRWVRGLPLLRTFSRLGWVVTMVALLAWIGAWQLGWKELAVVAGSCVAIMAGSALFTFGRVVYSVNIELQPKRVTAGDRASGRLVIRNTAGRRQLPSRMELKVGVSSAEFHIPTLAADGEHDELFSIPSERRAVIPVGPVVSVKGDPVGLCRVEKVWTGVEELFVHPRISPLDRLGSGFVKDLEGQTTNDLSASDIAFHTLREYVPGDDRRHVHWKTSARIGQLMVRQYVDTRRSHLAVIMSTAPADYADEQEFELAVSLAGSLAVRTLRDEQTVAMIAGNKAVPSANAQLLLDGLARVEFGAPEGHLQAGAIQASKSAASASIVAFVVGSPVELPEIRLASQRLGTDARLVVLRAHLGGELSYRPLGAMAVINVPSLDEFAQGLWRATQV